MNIVWSAAALLPLSSTTQSPKSYRAPEPVFRAVLLPNHHIATANKTTGRINLQYAGETPMYRNTTTYPIATSNAGTKIM
jgi:hypothetical protein